MLQLEVGQEYYDGHGRAVKIVHKGSEVDDGRVYYLGVVPSVGTYGMDVGFYYESGRRAGGSDTDALRAFDWTQLKQDDLVEVERGGPVVRRYVDRISRTGRQVYLFSDGVTSKTFDPTVNKCIPCSHQDIRRVIERSPDLTPASP